MSRGQRVGERVALHLGALVREAVECWHPHGEATGHEIVADLPPELVVHSVAGPISQVLVVLVANACAHGVGRITVGAKCHDKYVLISVRDEGPATIEREVFTRGTRSGDRDGHGLGLTIASQFATALGGYLTLADRPNTTVVLALPGRDVQMLERDH